jgi:hypothetical protein
MYAMSNGREIERLEVAEGVMPALFAPHLEAAAARLQPAVAQAEMPRQVVIERVAARLRLERQHEGRVGVDVDRLDRIHLDRYGEAHVSIPSGDGSIARRAAL